MSARNKKSLQNLQQTHDGIMDLLVKTKPNLSGTDTPNQPLLVQNLHQVASLAESFSEQRPRSNSNWSHLADNLDQEGSELAQFPIKFYFTPQQPLIHQGLVLVGAIRLAAFRLIEAGLELKPSIETLVHLLRIASKTGNTLSEIKKNDVAATILTAAAKYEEMLRSLDDSDKVNQQSVACATVVYFSTRMEAAWREGNYAVAEYASHMIMSDDQRLAVLPPHDKKLLIYKLFQIGKSLLQDKGHSSPSKPSNAIDWLRNAFKLVEQLEEVTMPGTQELRISLLRTIARAYFLDGAYDRAEATLDEVIPSIDSQDQGSPEHQDLRWLKLAILKRRGAGVNDLFEAFKTVVNHMEMSEADITDILQELKILTPFTLVTSVKQHCLQRALQLHGTGSDSIDRLLLSLIFHCAKDDDHARGMKTLEAAFTSVLEADVELRGVPATACLTLIWQRGDRHYQAKKWTEAADWYLAGTHQLFKERSSMTCSKCYRKAAICYLEQKEYAKASTVIRRCPANEAATCYVTFLIAIHQGQPFSSSDQP
ncbi:hypothetical protein Ac2012v2_000056 [Leucoagaricus gongylophorus]